MVQYVKLGGVGERDVYWDKLKGVLIFFVVLGHFVAYSPYTNRPQLQALENFVLLFHMPLFLFVSGRFSKKEEYKKSLFKIACLVETYIVFQLFNHVNIDILECRPVSLWFRYPATVSWYLLTLVYYRLLIAFIPEKYLAKQKFIIPVLFVVSLLAGFSPLSYDFSFQRTMVYMFFFYIGYCTKDVDFSNLFQRLKSWHCIMLVLAFFSFFIITNIDLSNVSTCARNYYQINQNTGYGYIRIVGIRASILISAVVISICLMKLVSIIKNSFIVKIGETSMLIYIYHIFFAKIYQHFNQLVDMPNGVTACMVYSILTLFIIMLIGKMKLFTLVLNPISKLLVFLCPSKSHLGV